MTLTPEDIERKVFKQEFRGYDQQEVDTFLDRIVDQMVEFTRERDLSTSRLREAERHASERVARAEGYAEERVAEIEKRASEAIENERLLKRALLTAERAADETRAQANSEAEQTLSDAVAQAEQDLMEARREADQILADARRQAGSMMAEARERTTQAQESYRFEFDRIQRTVADFQRLRDEYRDRVRATVNEHLSRIEAAGDLPAVPPQLIDLTKVPQPTWPDVAQRSPDEDQRPFAGVDTGNGDPPRSGSQ